MPTLYPSCLAREELGSLIGSAPSDVEARYVLLLRSIVDRKGVVRRARRGFPKIRSPFWESSQ